MQFVASQRDCAVNVDDDHRTGKLGVVDVRNTEVETEPASKGAPQCVDFVSRS